MWYFSWILGLGFAAASSVISGILFEYKNNSNNSD
ncbi:cytochrome bd-I oxidase subunit CydX [Candidatus Kinetoplastidibacterium blastocrithidiae]|nr:cytochrome bd-I oxidase subunit CydX [Candidatus Kinetoplastibacterium blastocrithidii]